MGMARISAVLCFLGLTQLALAGAAPPLTVSTTQPVRRDVTRWIRLPATATADAEVTIYAKVTGVLRDFTLDIGDRVKPGQAIGRLEVPEFEQDVKLAEAQLAAARAELQTAVVQAERTRIHGEEIAVQELAYQAELAKAKAETERNRKEFERTQKLANGEAATEREREIQTYAYQMSEAGVRLAESKLASLKPERALWQKDIEAAQAAVAAAKAKAGVAEAAVNRARVWLAYTELKVPQVGTHLGRAAVVTKRFATNGDLIPGSTGPRSENQAVVALQVIDPVRVVVDVPEYESPWMTSSTTAQVAFAAWPKEKPLAAKVSRTANVLASSARTLRMEIDLANAGGRLKPGMMADVELATETHRGVLAAPAACVLTAQAGKSVFAVEGGKARRIPVEVGFEDHGWVEVRAASLSETTLLIKGAPANLSDGAPVAVAQP